MAHYSGSERARLEKERRQRQFWEQRKMKMESSNYGRNNGSEESFFFFEYTEWRMRRIAPFAILIHVLAILFTISWFIAERSYHVTTVAVDFSKSGMAKIDVPKSEAVYRFEVSQDFPSDRAPLYSALEIEILDESLDHVYSVYKNLWQELHPNGEGGKAIYRDLKMDFEIELTQADPYFLRPISHDSNMGPVRVNVFKKVLGGIYFRYYAIFFGILSILLIILSEKLGSPSMMYNVLPKLRSWKDNGLFKIAASACVILVIGVWLAAFNNYGFASGGEETILPSYFYRTNTVTYLG